MEDALWLANFNQSCLTIVDHLLSGLTVSVEVDELYLLSGWLVRPEFLGKEPKDPYGIPIKLKLF